ncbi:hypothetical protein VKT23_010790 [Stygiomarasmius scandens]|uniref:Uncharacterized protein n=1 Tax=Marasmiellus scandens TaxID=2682957 RepID=A0ABR1JFU6_9AGAR
MVMTLLECNRRLEARLRNIEDATAHSPSRIASGEYVPLNYGVSLDGAGTPSDYSINGNESIPLGSSLNSDSDAQNLSTIVSSQSLQEVFGDLNLALREFEVDDWSSSPPSSSSSSIIAGFESSSANTRLSDLRLIFLNHNLQLGLSLTQIKVDALRAGDLSGQIIHPILVHISHLWGCLFSQPDRITPSPEEEGYLQSVLELLATMVADQDILSYIQAYCLTAVYFYFKLQISTGRDLLLKAIDAVQRRGLDTYLSGDLTGFDIPEKFYQGGIPLIALDDTDEERNALLQLLYIDRASEMLLKLPSLLSQQLNEVLQKFTKRNMLLTSSSNIPVARAVSISLLYESQKATSGFIPGIGASI